MNKTQNSDYELLDSGDGRKFERFGEHSLVRPCSQAVWKPSLSESEWRSAAATFDRAEGNRWHNRSGIPEEWNINVAGINFILSGTDFGHLGIFPEQRAQWEWINKTVKKHNAERSEPLKVLNLFAYSGGSTLAAALGGAHLCHLDASKGMVQWARRNADANGLKEHPVRWIVDDAHKFMCRELRRDRRYDAIILDPPTFGRGQNNEMYKIEEDLPETLNLCRQLLTKDPAFILLSAHTPGYSPVVLQNVLGQSMKQHGGSTSTGEMLLTGAEGGSADPLRRIFALAGELVEGRETDETDITDLLRSALWMLFGFHTIKSVPSVLSVSTGTCPHPTFHIELSTNYSAPA